MERSSSDTHLLHIRKQGFDRHMPSPVPGYLGHIPGQRIEGGAVAATFARSVLVGRSLRARATFDAQDFRLPRKDAEVRARSSVQMPRDDARILFSTTAGNVNQSRISASKSAPGLTSAPYERLGAQGKLEGSEGVARCIPGYTGHVPGKVGENVFGEPWSKLNERSRRVHLAARAEAPRERSLVTEGGTLVAPTAADRSFEVPIRSTSYQDHTRGWSACEYTGASVMPAGRLAPKDRQEAFGTVPPRPNAMPIHGYAGWVPGRIGESVYGERQCQIIAISDDLFKKNRMRNMQR